MNDSKSSNAMDEVKKAFNSFTSLVEKDIKGVHIGCYSVALIGLTIAIRKVRPFSKFKGPKDIPNHFIEERRELTGLVKRIDPNGALLMVEHQPLVNIPFIKSGQLPVKISGLQVSGLGLNWLQAVVSGKEIKFVPVTKEPNFVQCQVLLVQKTEGKTDDYLNIGERLLKIGFAQTVPAQPPLSEDPVFLTYYKRLLAAEDFALKKKLGFKYYIKPTKNAFSTMFKNVTELSKLLSKSAKKYSAKPPNFSSA